MVKIVMYHNSGNDISLAWPGKAEIVLYHYCLTLGQKSRFIPGMLLGYNATIDLSLTLTVLFECLLLILLALEYLLDV